MRVSTHVKQKNPVHCAGFFYCSLYPETCTLLIFFVKEQLIVVHPRFGIHTLLDHLGVAVDIYMEVFVQLDDTLEVA